MEIRRKNFVDFLSPLSKLLVVKMKMLNIITYINGEKIRIGRYRYIGRVRQVGGRGREPDKGGF